MKARALVFCQVGTLTASEGCFVCQSLFRPCLPPFLAPPLAPPLRPSSPAYRPYPMMRNCLLALVAVVAGDGRCPLDCAGRGTCSNGICECQQGFLPPDCSRSFSCPNNVRLPCVPFGRLPPAMHRAQCRPPLWTIVSSRRNEPCPPPFFPRLHSPSAWLRSHMDRCRVLFSSSCSARLAESASLASALARRDMLGTTARLSYAPMTAPATESVLGGSAAATRASPATTAASVPAPTTARAVRCLSRADAPTPRIGRDIYMHDAARAPWAIHPCSPECGMRAPSDVSSAAIAIALSP